MCKCDFDVTHYPKYGNGVRFQLCDKFQLVLLCAKEIPQENMRDETKDRQSS